MKYSIGIDIGGTNIAVVLIDESGTVKYTNERKTNYYGNDYLKNIVDLIAIAIQSVSCTVDGVGIGVPGTVDTLEGVVLRSPALKWENIPLKTYIENQFNLSAVIENDVNAWTMAEKVVGAGRESENFVMITIGTGIGAGLYLNNRIYHGFGFEAGEIGYFPIGLEAYNYQTLQEDFGFFEKKASARAVSQSYYEKTMKKKDCKYIFELARKKDEMAVLVTEEIYQYLGIGVSNIICILNPEKIILGGGMAQEGEIFLHKLKEKVERLIPMKTIFSLAETGSCGGAIGSGLLVFNQKDMGGYSLCSKKR
ncbi:MAG: ROK family protein [Thermotaleaceae bacterium]